ncbi:type II toxin-antitoxin system HicA family toxin [Candidatus Uhrbacteria bacterium]|nr:type II toxin-antitoxin system HicA family toxin [Candidatus Uhrbacteria bacterium]
MTPKMPVVNARELIRALERAGFFVARQSGSHVIMKRISDKRRVVVPSHVGDVHQGIMRSILHQANMPVDEFLNLL